MINHLTRGARSIQPKFPEISVQNSMDRFGPTGKVSKKRVHLLRWTTFPGRTGWNFGWMDRARGLSQNVRLMYEKFLERLTTLTISVGLDTDLQRKAPYLKTAICPKLLHAAT